MANLRSSLFGLYLTIHQSIRKATWRPKAVDGAVDEMSKSIQLFSAVQGHVTRAKNNLAETLAHEHVHFESTHDLAT